MIEQGELSGVNKRCSACEKDCKQWKQVTVVFCPNEKVAKVKKGV
jgi:hypothetical protein